MAKKSISQKRAERQQQENQALNRVFLVFLLGLAAECYLFVVYRNYVMGSVPAMLAWRNVLRYGSVIGLVLLIAGAVLAVASALFTANTTGLPDFRSMAPTSWSEAVSPV